MHTIYQLYAFFLGLILESTRGQTKKWREQPPKETPGWL
jgi:hypothetical protein